GEVPLTETLKVTGVPEATDWSCGWAVICGGLDPCPKRLREPTIKRMTATRIPMNEAHHPKVRFAPNGRRTHFTSRGICESKTEIIPGFDGFRKGISVKTLSQRLFGNRGRAPMG